MEEADHIDNGASLLLPQLNKRTSSGSEHREVLYFYLKKRTSIEILEVNAAVTNFHGTE
jgi:hypothetical protein